MNYRKNFDFFVIIFLFFFVGFSAAASNPIVKISYGELLGRFYDLKNGDQAVGFLGVPYASPPVGDLRFKRPIPPQKWDGIRNATEFGNRCAQNEMMPMKKTAPGKSENCLFLNIFGPKEKINLQPVMVFIHGGGFLFGSTYEYGDQGICDFLVPKGVIVVSIQYRLGLFGFLSTNDAEAPGNYGLWDQIEALKWIQDNIENFGGDPKSVTIFGESAGSVSVSLLHHSPHSKNLFHRAILESGASYGPWTFGGGSEVSSLIGEFLGCDSENSKKFVECLKEKTTEEFLEADEKKNEKWAKISTSYFAWGPRMDGIFLPEDLKILAAKAPKRPMIIGINSDEEILMLKPPEHLMWRNTSSNVIMMIRNDEKFVKYGLHPGLEFLAQKTNFSQKTRSIVKELLEFFYFIGQPNSDMKNASYAVEKFIELQSDVWFVIPSYVEAIQHATADQSVWFYEFGHYPKTYFKRQNYRGSFHTMELAFILGTSIGRLLEFEWSEEDFAVADFITTLWTNFAKFGNPTKNPVDGITWEKFKSDQPRNLFIDSKPSMRSKFRPQNVAFWTEFLPKLDEILSSKENEKTDQKTNDHWEL